MTPRWTIVLGACACATAGAYVYAVNPAEGGYPRCLLYETTGYYCAGCGATRAMYALLHGRAVEALHDNLFLMMLLPVIASVVIPFALRAWRSNRWPEVYLSQRALAILGIAITALGMVFMTVRNMPGSEFDWLRPLA